MRLATDKKYRKKTKSKGRMPIEFLNTERKSCALFSKWFRSKRGLNMRDAADLIGVNFSLIGQIETARLYLPLEYMKKIYKIADPEERKYLIECIYADIDSFIDF